MMNVQLAAAHCLLFVIVYSGVRTVGAIDYSVVDSDGKHVGKIQMDAAIYLPSQEKKDVPSNVTVLGTIKQSDMTVSFDWKTVNTSNQFNLFFKSVGDHVFLNSATFSSSDSSKTANSYTWMLNKNLGSSNASYQCRFLYAISENVGSTVHAELVLRSLRIQVYNFHSDFSDPILCDEDKPGMWLGNWTLINSDGTPCLRLTGAIVFNITYTTMEKHYSTASINLPPSAVVMPGSSCSLQNTDVNSTVDQLLQLGFYDRWTLGLHFTRDPNVTHDKQEIHWMVDWIELKFQYENFHFPNTIRFDVKKLKNDVSSTGEGALGLFRTRSDRSYSCNAVQEKVVVQGNLTVVTEFVQAQPFMSHPQFSQVESCAADMMVSDVVPIIIGAALAILIVVVLVAYLVGRARTRRQTYENI